MVPPEDPLPVSLQVIEPHHQLPVCQEQLIEAKLVDRSVENRCKTQRPAGDTELLKQVDNGYSSVVSQALHDLLQHVDSSPWLKRRPAFPLLLTRLSSQLHSSVVRGLGYDYWE